MSVRLSLIIPAYNEAGRIGPSLAIALAYLQAQPYESELLVIDDGSRDDTAAICRAVLNEQPNAQVVGYQPNRGKGYAVRTGVLAAQGEWVAFLDADMSTLPDEIDNAWSHIAAGAEMVIGSRAHPAAEIMQPAPWFRRLSTDIFTATRSALVGLRQYHDTQCGFKVYQRAKVQPLYQKAIINRFMFDVEILYLAEKAGLRVVEMPVRWADAKGSKVRVLAGFWQMLRDLIRIRWQHG
jgi:dolichyl-phosphate beta-glucosyltransferase